MKKLALVIISALFLVVAAACSSNEKSKEANTSEPKEKTEETKEITVKHLLDETKVKKNPEKVVVFDFGVLDSLDKLGVEVAGVPQKVVPEYLSKYKDEKYVNTGSLKEPDFEKMAEIGPELIIISARQQDLYEEFKEIAPTIYMGVDPTQYMESFKGNMTTLGEIFGKESEVESELAKIDDDIKELKKLASDGDQKGLVTLVTGGKVNAYGPGSRFGLIHEVFGVTPADEKIEASTHGANISFEYIAEKNPDYLFVIDRDAVVGGEAAAKKTIENDLVKKTNAYKENKIIYLDPNYWYLAGGGLQSMSEMVKEVKEGIQ
ncbi:iron complex transport system substrate-binding protein [Oikeobacillus pervagus]|uniref:Iron complex transport system substrate-binding protein n=1 Tax=Oikeobacillus pervagus TaxID=1325931 RepID=A0AAJ1WKE2_9BACI|nr:siderophore ABC transporter substrate-binding protein [Oikeobacillus pervagus]MDQ0216660.1 iron complex transport system substrate-binding protein [Oikeobacillus pervagus]